MAKEKKPEEQKGGAPAWMMTYGDMMSLLLTFFVLIVSFSSIQESGFKSAMGSLQGALGVLQPRAGEFFLDTIIHPDTVYTFMSTKRKQTTGDISETLNFLASVMGAELNFDDKGVHIILPAEVMFESGSDAIKEESRPDLRKIGAFLFENKSQIIIEGHTDNIPISSSRFPSNWELSVARATSVMRFFNEAAGIPFKNMSVAGYGEFNPIASNDTPEGREENRRVEIVILTQEKPKSYVLR